MLTSKRKAHLIVVTAFILGIVVGGSGQFLLSQPPPPVASTPVDVADEMTRAAKLDQSQRSQVLQILGDCQKQSQDLREQIRPQYQAIREKARNRIRAILSPEQLISFNQWINDLDARREKEKERKQTNK
jgi:cation diffusion facilitator CzcD-associated flavoprotein CzcO